jgi:hypothetical protein
MRRLRLGLVTVVAVGALGLLPPAGAAAATDGTGQATHRDFDRDDFPKIPRIDNQWLPLVPGTQFVFRGQASQGGGVLPHDVIFTVTDLTKVVKGVRTLVLWDRDFSEGELVEAELTFHAQDVNGNVWNLGEYPEEYEGGVLVGAPSTWLAGRQHAKAGIASRANPRVNTSKYLQGLAPEIDFKDRAFVAKEGQRTCVPVACYDDVIVIDETNVADPEDGHQLKLHAPGVGVVRIDPGRRSQDLESLVLVEIRHLNARQLAQAREEALKLDKRAYEVAPDVYGRSKPAKRLEPDD